MSGQPSENKRLKIAYLCETSPLITWAHSGGNTRIYNALKEYVGDVTILDNRWSWFNFVRKGIEKLPFSIHFRLKFRVHLLLSRFIARYIEKQLKKEHYDVLFCSYSFFCLSHLKLPYPMLTVFTSDATYTIYKNSDVGKNFGSFLKVSRLFDSYILSREKAIFRSLDLLLWPSEWIKQGADDCYQLNNEQSHIVHWGANIPKPSRNDIQLNNPLEGEVRLLLVGRDWFPKGGPIALDTLKALLDRGINAHLTVVGCEIPEFHRHERMTTYRQLFKNDPEQLEIFSNLYKTSHFFIMPSYEAYGFAFCEAAAFGLPALCLKVGGVPVKDGVNGHPLPKGSGPEDFAQQIEHYMKHPDDYNTLRASTRQFYEEHLNWQAWGERVAQHIKDKQHESALKTLSPSEDSQK